MHEPLIPPALVLGCNTPHGINVLSDWIEEQTGHAPDFAGTSWSEWPSHGDGYSVCYGSADGNGYGDGRCIGCWYGDGYGNGRGDGYGHGRGDGDGFGCGTGLNYCFGYGTTSGDGYGNGDEICHRSGYTEHSGFWQRIGQRLRQLIE